MKLKEAIKKYKGDNVGIALKKDGALISIDEALTLDGNTLVYGVYDLDFMTVEYEKKIRPKCYQSVIRVFLMNKLKFVCTLVLTALLLTGLVMINESDRGVSHSHSADLLGAEKKCFSNTKYKYCDFKNSKDVFVAVRGK